MDGPGTLGLDPHGDALVGRDPQDQGVGLQAVLGRLPEGQVADLNWTTTSVARLAGVAGADVERVPGPAPVVDPQLGVAT